MPRTRARVRAPFTPRTVRAVLRSPPRKLPLPPDRPPEAASKDLLYACLHGERGIWASGEGAEAHGPPENQLGLQKMDLGLHLGLQVHLGLQEFLEAQISGGPTSPPDGLPGRSSRASDPEFGLEGASRGAWREA